MRRVGRSRGQRRAVRRAVRRRMHRPMSSSGIPAAFSLGWVRGLCARLLGALRAAALHSPVPTTIASAFSKGSALSQQISLEFPAREGTQLRVSSTENTQPYSPLPPDQPWAAAAYRCAAGCRCEGGCHWTAGCQCAGQPRALEQVPDEASPGNARAAPARGPGPGQSQVGLGWGRGQTTLAAAEGGRAMAAGAMAGAMLGGNSGCTHLAAIWQGLSQQPAETGLCNMRHRNSKPTPTHEPAFRSAWTPDTGCSCKVTPASITFKDALVTQLPSLEHWVRHRNLCRHSALDKYSTVCSPTRRTMRIECHSEHASPPAMVCGCKAPASTRNRWGEKKVPG